VSAVTLCKGPRPGESGHRVKAAGVMVGSVQYFQHYWEKDERGGFTRPFARRVGMSVIAALCFGVGIAIFVALAKQAYSGVVNR
jgi:hypothetical protein